MASESPPEGPQVMTPDRIESSEGGPAQPSKQPAPRADDDPEHILTSIADEDGADRTASAPVFPRHLPRLKHVGAPNAPALLADGEIIDDFEILQLLGRGAAGAVYLARQQSLDRRVALKITRNLGSEARTMATLEHAHIVQVFSETIDRAGDMRLLCMQYVPGATLAEVIARLRELPRTQLSGRTLLAAVDELESVELPFDADAFRERERLASADYVEAVCRIMIQLAEALHFAHQHGVLHRDIKPANILMDPFGRPLLADFSLSFAARSQGPVADEVFGGTLAYMAPEHLDAFNSASATTPEVVDQRSDIYSLGVVLYQMLALKLPHGMKTVKHLDGHALRALEQARQSPPPALHLEFPEIPYALGYTTHRCLAGDPEQRFPDAGKLGDALEGSQMLERARQQLPPAGLITRIIAQAPLAAAIALSFLPHLLGSLFITAYDALILFPRFSNTQQLGLAWISALYGGVTFPLIIVVVLIVYLPAVRVWRCLDTDVLLPTEEVDRARGRLLTVPMAAVGLSALAWLPLLLFIPTSLQLMRAGMSLLEFGHMAVSVLLALLIAATYSFFVLQYVILRVFYPLAWADATRFHFLSRQELAPVPSRLRAFQIAAGFVPLVGAILILTLSPEAFEADSHLAFRWLTFGLIVLGMAGIPISIHVGGLIAESIDAFLGPR